MLIPKELEGFKILSKGIPIHIHAHVISYETKFKIYQTVRNNLTTVGVLLVLVGLFIAETRAHKLLIGIPLFLFNIVAFEKNHKWYQK